MSRTACHVSAIILCSIAFACAYFAAGVAEGSIPVVAFQDDVADIISSRNFTILVFSVLAGTSALLSGTMAWVASPSDDCDDR